MTEVRIVTYQVEACKDCHFCENGGMASNYHHCKLTAERLTDTSKIGFKCPLEEVPWEESDFYYSKEDYEADMYDDMRREGIYD